MKPEEVIFADVLALPPTEREAFLARRCGADAPLRRRVELLLRGFDEAGPVFARRPVYELFDAARAPNDLTGREHVAGMTIGRYRLLQQLGEGGCGAVFMAEQEEPLRRRVAVKVIKLGMDTREVIARFEAERQALALMDHPNIAHVLDAGSTESGRPFFVMELVRGTPITRYCDDHGLGTNERLQLFAQVCHAVQHAHQKGIIHRDLKPSNILVTLHDGMPVPKVIDFGIAKATQGRLTDKTLFTAFEQFVGTPAYMAPEQAEMNAYDVDTRSDIYSLGVLLYELLTGRTPFESQELARAGVDEMRRIIREREPPKPSTRLSAIDLATGITIARQRGTEPAKLSASLRGDLDWIVMRCLEKDRARRYETANGLAQDLERHRRGEPVAARPPGAVYLLHRAIRRNKLAFAAAVAVVASLAGGLAFAVAALQREHAARQRADLEVAHRAQVAHFMEDMLAGVGPQAALGRDTNLLRAILDETVVRMQQELQGQPEVEADLRATLGKVYDDLGEMAAATLMHERALALRRQLFGENHPAVAASLHALGDVLTRRGRYDEAGALLGDALMLREKLLGADDPATVTSRTALMHLQLLRDGTSGPPGSSPPVDDGPDVIRVAFPGGMSGGRPVLADILTVAFQQRVLENEFGEDGIRIEWSSYANSRTLNEADARTLPDLSNMGPAAAVYARAGGFDYKVVLALRRFDANFCFVVRADSPFQSVADMKGRRLAVGKGFFRHLTLCRILSAHGLGENDCEVLRLDGPAAVRAAFAGGEVDGRLADMDDPADREAAGAVRVLYDTGRDLDRVGVGQLCVSEEFERNYPAIVQRVVTALVKTAAWASDEKNRAAVLESWALSAEHRDILERNYASYTLKERISPLLDDSFLAGLRRDSLDAKRFGLVEQDAKADWHGDAWIEPSYLRQALRELGLEDFWPQGNPGGDVRNDP